MGDVDIIVKQKGCSREYYSRVAARMVEKRGIEYYPSENTQMLWLLFLNPDDLTQNLLEVKAFNRNMDPVLTLPILECMRKK